MKTIFCTFLVTVALVASAAAAPKLILDTIVTESDAQGKDTQLAHFHVLTTDGKKTVMPVGKYRYVVTPVLRKHNTVELVSIYTHPVYTGKDTTLGPDEQTAALSERSDISYGAVTYSTKVTKAR